MFLDTMLGLLSFLPSWTQLLPMCTGRSLSIGGEDTITTGAMWTVLPLDEMQRSRKYVDISSLCQDLRLPQLGFSICFSKEDFRGDDWRTLRTVRGLMSSKLEVLWHYLTCGINVTKLGQQFTFQKLCFVFCAFFFPLEACQNVWGLYLQV